MKGPVSGATTSSYLLTTVCTGDVLVEVAGSSYLDEASDTTMPLSTSLRVMVATNGGTATGIAAPLTTMADSYAFRTPATAASTTTAAFNGRPAASPPSLTWAT